MFSFLSSCKSLLILGQRVFLKDIGSLHGTFINNTRLKKLQAQAVKDGDYIQFGIPVDRGTDTCPPCIMRVTVQYGAPKYVSLFLKGLYTTSQTNLSDMSLALSKAQLSSESLMIATMKSARKTT